jgi:hypothetical protein
VFETVQATGQPKKPELIEAFNASVRDFNRAVFAEDKDICEAVQMGIAESSARGALGDAERRVWDFQANYMRFMETSA